MQRLDPDRSLLVFIDVQERLAPAMQPRLLEATLRASRILLEAARHLKVRVAATEQYPKGLGPTVEALRGPLAAMGVEFLAKDTFSALGEPAFLRVLNAPPPRQVVLVGMETHVCVYQTARDLASLGFEVHVVADGVASRNEEHHQAGLRLCERAGAIVTTAETVAFDWLGRAGSEAFKAVSRAVR